MRAVGTSEPTGRRPGRSARWWALLAVGLAAWVTIAGAAPAQAAAYRYWSYWWGSGGSWTYADAGAAAHVPPDGGVEGWRFAVSGDGATSSRPPRAAADFAALCAGTPPVQGKKRVGVVIDYGSTDDGVAGEAPPAARGACAVVPTTATGAAVLAAVAAYRVDAGLVCGIDGYPRSGCAEVVADPTTASPTTATRSSSSAASTGTARTTPSASPTAASSAAEPAAPAPAPTVTSAPATPSTGRTKSPTVTTDLGGGRDTGESPVALATAAPVSGTGGSPAGVIVGVLLVAGLAGAGAWWARRAS